MALVSIWGFTTLREQDGGVPVAGVTLDNLNRLSSRTSQEARLILEGSSDFSQPSALGWHEQILHSFGGGVDGTQPFGTMIFDRNGNLYGTTYSGGSSDDGTVFKLTPNGSGSWTETILYSFTGPPSGGSDGANPEAGLVFDAAGNLYGTTQFGGPTGTGTVFKLTPSVDGTWNESLLYAFNGADGAHPACVPSFDRAGNLTVNRHGGPMTTAPYSNLLRPSLASGRKPCYMHSQEERTVVTHCRSNSG